MSLLHISKYQWSFKQKNSLYYANLFISAIEFYISDIDQNEPLIWTEIKVREIDIGYRDIK